MMLLFWATDPNESVHQEYRLHDTHQLKQVYTNFLISKPPGKSDSFLGTSRGFMVGITQQFCASIKIPSYANENHSTPRLHPAQQQVLLTLQFGHKEAGVQATWGGRSWRFYALALSQIRNLHFLKSSQVGEAEPPTNQSST